ncbi:3-deoxy-manno-octulosonate cytidylyltransferase [Telmatocola sphagniphila]|uniref:3-deoxy-manno-octulosonate cytidylyltransferase n=1 Tax=Telmatocola sphagniphila TaxID=1123043 RepID=UPI001FE47C3E|nr:3-deoxy-manno-octulosonate cytidylyltransferase [Telmatocola sphagniphila]
MPTVKTAILIPARFASTRLPAKALLRETGKYLIEHVYEQASQTTCASDVIVATDDERILRAVASFGGRVVLTATNHQSGTDRIAEVAQSLDSDILINVQGDEPTIDPKAIDLLDSLMRTHPEAEMATLAVPFDRQENWQSPNMVKVVTDAWGRAIYFSRSPIPYCRDGTPDFSSGKYLQHLGIYAYRRESLLKLASLPPHPLEDIEKLEQLRAIAQGWAIQVGVVAHAGRGIDTPEDYALFVNSYRQQILQSRRAA